MRAAKKLIAGAILIGAGKALEYIGGAIFSATGSAEGPIVSYEALIGISSTVLIALGVLIGVYGVLQGIYHLWKNRGSGGETEKENPSRRSQSDSSPSSRRDRPRNPSR